jgi:hypothetical protein
VSSAELPLKRNVRITESGLREWIKTKADKGGNAAGACGAIMFFAVLLLFVGIAVLIAMQPGATVSFGDSSRQLHGRRGNQW